ncbi:AbrB/MazE/SpoVT family DNA-binding domain-containing protein [bacterium]|nr:AbrB/MazE/SpoVT family DNA-binding domain-containing protein [bacterium]
MTKRLVRHGNSWALVIDKPIRQLLDIEEGSLLELSLEGKCLVVRRVPDDGDPEEFEKALESINKRYGKMLKRLAE